MDSLRFVARGVTRPGGNRIGRTRVGIEGGGEGPDGAELLGVVAVGEEVGRKKEVARIGKWSDLVGNGEVIGGEEVHKMVKKKKKEKEGEKIAARGF